MQLFKNHSIKVLLSAAAALAAVTAVGCGGSSGSRSSSSTVAASTSGTPSGTTSGTTAAAVSSNSLHDPAGQIGLVGSATNPVQAILSTDAYVAFKEQQSISDLVMSDDPALADRAFVVEDKGTVRILDLSGAAPVLDRAVDLFAGPLAQGISAGKLNLISANKALVVTSGTNGEGVAMFDPLTARDSNDVVWFDFNGITATWAAGTLNNKGVDVGAQPIPMSYTADATIAGGKLIYISSNLDSNFDYNPGTITAYDYDTATNTLSGGAFMMTSDFNPTGITRVGDLLLVTNSGPFGGTEGSIDVIDPDRFELVGTIRFPASTNPTGQITISPDGKRGYVASQSKAEVYVLDLSDLDQLAGQQSLDLSARYQGGYDLESQVPSNFVSSIAISHTGNYLYAVSFNESALTVIDLVEGKRAARVEGFARSGLPASFEGLANKIVVRPGEPGVDYQGASILTMTINLAQADRTLQDVTVALDTVTVDRH